MVAVLLTNEAIEVYRLNMGSRGMARCFGLHEWPAEFAGDVSSETKHTTRNVLVANATAIFAVSTGSKLSELAVLKEFVTDEQYVNWALFGILAAFIVSHILTHIRSAFRRTGGIIVRSSSLGFRVGRTLTP